ncbi:MAG: ankyrin repeat domain-containing protein [Rivularia sp. (in: cyanobacteria)]
MLISGDVYWKAMELFEREAKILAQLNHRAIPDYLEYFDVDTDGEKYFYIAQQLAPGDSLAKLVENNWRTNEQQIKDIAKQILEILIYLHSLTPAVTHRDIKPQNIIRNKDEKVFLVDFGAVQDTYYSTFMRGSTVVGTYGYMAPEQFRGQAVPATDLYGLGATLLFLLTHRSPADFPTDGLKIDFRSQVKVSDDFADWLDKMLEPDLEERFASAKVALEVLQGKRKIILGKQKPMLLKVAIAMGITTVITASIFNNYKWAILNTLGIQPSSNICDSPYWIKDYISKGGNPNTEFSINALYGFKKGLLLCAIEENSLETAELLIAKGANVNDALHYVQSVKDAKFLIAKGADVNHKNELGWTPLHHAAIFYRKDIVELFLSHQANVNTRNKAGYTPLNIISGGKSGMGKYIDNPYIIRDVYRNRVDQITKKSTIKLLIDNGATFD